MTVQLPQFLNLDGVYGASALGLPFRFLVTEGITGTGDYAVTQNGTPNMSVNVAAGVAFVLGDDSPDAQPNYVVRNDATVNVALTPADVTNPRIDLIVLEVRDSVFSGSFDDGRLRAVAGTPAGSPVPPALPNNCMELARVAVAASDTTIVNADITDRRPIATPGGELLTATGRLVIVCTTATRPGSPADGQVIWDTTTNQLMIWSSTAGAWVLPDPARPASSMYVIQCTSGTRPGSPVDGQPIYETDTDEAMLYSALSAGWVKPNGALMGYGARTANEQFATSGTVSDAQVTFTAVANRRYHVSIGIEMICQTPTPRVEVRIKRGATTIQAMEQSLSNTLGWNWNLEVVDEPGAGSVTYSIECVRINGSGWIQVQAQADHKCTMVVKDAGPG